MAEEKEKKAVVVHKKVNKPSAPQTAASTPAENTAKTEPAAKRKIVIKTKVSAEKKKTPESESPAAKPAQTAENQTPKAEKKTVPEKREQQSSQGQSKSFKRTSSFEINSSRPNVKAGNLSEHTRGGYGNREGGRQGGFNRDGQGRGGFTGAQARQGYQNRERDGQGRDGRQGGFNRDGQGRGGFNRDGRQGGFNRDGQGRGGFNRDGQNRGNGGFNRGGQGGFGGGQGRTFAPPADNITTNKTAAKKKFTGKKQTYSRKDREEAFDEDKFFETKKKVETPASVVPAKIDIMESISVSDLARKMNLKASEIIGKLMSMGMMVTITQSIDSDTATLLAAEYNCEVHLVSLYDETVIASDTTDDENMLPRAPIVTVMGHVDHGKTKTLDAIRHANVAAGEAGGITQAIGAYSVKTPKGSITFLDTPGHEAFTMMRARGAQITDIVVLVVAADDGVMPQTLEAINHAKDAKVPIIVAVNKVDKPEANPERVKTQLSELGLTPEEWGGDTQYVHISALKKEGIDDLLDAILLQAEMLELKSAWDCRAEGKILESRVDQGRGVVATVVVQKGTLKQGDPYVAGIYSGRVRAMFDDKGKRITEAGPSTPIEVLGMEEMPNAGDPFQVTESEKEARAISAKRQELKRFEAAKAVKKTTLESLYSDIADSEVKELKVIIKADLQGSAEALKTSLEKLTTREIRLNVIHSSAGAINESDVTLAAADENAIIIGFNVRPTPKAKALAEQESVEIRKYNIIYKCVEEIQQAMEGMLSPDTKEEVIGQVEVRDTFKVPKIGVIAGCYVTEGSVKRTCTVNIIREGIVIHNGKIASLKRFKDDAKEVQKGFECGIGIVDWQDIKVGDTLEIIDTVEVARKLGDSIAKEKEAEAKTDTAVSGDAE
ncbi:MAG: translation initiation factor IF-2 [Treponema sp.]|nr:translation initiation factor IF-2 [Candidatus Treponema merdequi]